MLYLTARGIGMASTTREYLESIDQDGCTLPPGPCLLSPSRLIESFTREVIRRNPEEFKIACLREIRALWPPEHNPFYAGFGNRDSDEMAYIAAGMPRARIFIINPQSEIRMAGTTCAPLAVCMRAPLEPPRAPQAPPRSSSLPEECLSQQATEGSSGAVACAFCPRALSRKPALYRPQVHVCFVPAPQGDCTRDVPRYRPRRWRLQRACRGRILLE